MYVVIHLLILPHYRNLLLTFSVLCTRLCVVNGTSFSEVPVCALLHLLFFTLIHPERHIFKVSRNYVLYSSEVAQLFETLRYKPEGHGYVSRCYLVNFSLT